MAAAIGVLLLTMQFAVHGGQYIHSGAGDYHLRGTATIRASPARTTYLAGFLDYRAGRFPGYRGHCRLPRLLYGSLAASAANLFGQHAGKVGLSNRFAGCGWGAGFERNHSADIIFGKHGQFCDRIGGQYCRRWLHAGPGRFHAAGSVLLARQSAAGDVFRIGFSQRGKNLFHSGAGNIFTSRRRRAHWPDFWIPCFCLSSAFPSPFCGASWRRS